MTDEQRLELHREKYYFEQERKEQLKGIVAIPLGMITLLFGYLGYLFDRCASHPQIIIRIISGSVILALFITLIIAFLNVWKSFYKYTYAYIPTSKAIEDHWTTLREYYNKYPEAGKSDDMFRSVLINEFIKDADHNFNLNNIRISFLYKANKMIVISLILASIAICSLSGQRFYAWITATFLPRLSREEVSAVAPHREANTPATTAPTPAFDSIHNRRGESEEAKATGMNEVIIGTYRLRFVIEQVEE